MCVLVCVCLSMYMLMVAILSSCRENILRLMFPWPALMISHMMISHMMMASNGNLWALLALCEGNPPMTGGFPLQRPVTRSFNDLRPNKHWANDGDAADLRRYRAYHDVSVMILRLVRVHDVRHQVIHWTNVDQVLGVCKSLKTNTDAP